MNHTVTALVEPHLRHLEKERILPRIWDHDYTVWRPDPEEIANRLGWLEVANAMEQERQGLLDFAQEARNDGIRDVVLLGMGGSSLGAEALASICDAPAGSPRLHVLDSTVPAWVERVTQATDPRHTLYVAASKSGTTAETTALLDYFWERAGRVLEAPAEHMVAITDPRTPLAHRALEQKFRKLFLNPDDIGGRFSVLSYFGLVPAALAGLDVSALLASAAEAQLACGPGIPTADNPAAQLGALLAGGALVGRDHLTLLTSPHLAAFGLWAEQLLAESTGKEGKGILPVAGEPFAAAECYGSDRVFVALRLAGDDNASLDRTCESLAASGQPVWNLELTATHELGYQFFLWELATAVAGHLLDIHPFNQPNVQAAKDVTKEILAGYQKSGTLPEVPAREDLSAALTAELPSYLAILAFLPPSDALEDAVNELRRVLLSRQHLATTFGYGPRYLHSTGQLHKGGPSGGLFLQIVATDTPPLDIPGHDYDFGTLVAAQALGDLRALENAGRRCLRVTAKGDGSARLDKLRASLD